MCCLLDPLDVPFSLTLLSSSLFGRMSPLMLLLSYSISEQVKLSFPLSSEDVELWLSTTGEWCRWFMCWPGTCGASLLLDTASNVKTSDDVRGRALSRSISSAVSPIGTLPTDCTFGAFGGTPGFFRLALELCPLSCDMTGLFKLLSLLLCKTSFPTPPDDDVVAKSALCNGFPEISCSVRILGCCELISELGESRAKGVL